MASISVSDINDWQHVCSAKRATRDGCIPKEWLIADKLKTSGTNFLQVPPTCGILSEDEIRITSDFDAVALSEALKNSLFTAEAVTRAFCKRAGIAQQLTNCLTEIFFEEGIETAKQLDQDRKDNPSKPLRPLHGLPISLKDSFHITGKDSTIGLVCYVDSPAREDAALVALLRSLGAVLYCKTNVPQTMMTVDSDNNVFGRTLNPNNINLTAGGSTGGEGALIALRGSILGVGTDVAGSIRIPSACCGIYGLKPSTGLVPYKGQQNITTPGMAGIEASAGPMATSVRACQFFLKTLLEANRFQFDDSVNNVSWQAIQPPQGRPLRIGVISDDGEYTPTPPLRRIIKQASDGLQAAGHEIIPIQLPNTAENMTLVWSFFALDGAKYVNELISSSGEPLVPSVQRTGLTTTPGKSLEELFELNHQRVLAQRTFNDIWRKLGLDIMLSLPAPHTAIPLDEWTAITYTSLYNLYGVPCIIIPVGKVSQELDRKDVLAKYGTRDQAVYDLYSGPAQYADAPLSLQLIGKKQEDEALLAVSIEIDRLLNR